MCNRDRTTGLADTLPAVDPGAGLRRAGAWRELVRRVLADFAEMPGMQLTLDQAVRLWNLDSAVCERVLNRLVDEGKLSQRPDGRYARP